MWNWRRHHYVQITFDLEQGITQPTERTKPDERAAKKWKWNMTRRWKNFLERMTRHIIFSLFLLHFYSVPFLFFFASGVFVLKLRACVCAFCCCSFWVIRIYIKEIGSCAKRRKIDFGKLEHWMHTIQLPLSHHQHQAPKWAFRSLELQHTHFVAREVAIWNVERIARTGWDTHLHSVHSKYYYYNKWMSFSADEHRVCSEHTCVCVHGTYR